MPTVANVALTELVEDSIVAWLQDTANTGITLGIIPRRLNEAKFEVDGVTLNDAELPTITVEAAQGKAVHNQIPVYFMDVEVMLWMQADDTNKAVWDDTAESIESMLLARDLAQYLTGEVSGLIVGDGVNGIVTRNMGRVEKDARHWKRSYRLQLWAGKNPQ